RSLDAPRAEIAKPPLIRMSRRVQSVIAGSDHFADTAWTARETRALEIVNSVLRTRWARSRNTNQSWQNIANPILCRLTKSKVQLAIHWIEFVVDGLFGLIGIELSMRRTNLILRLFDRLECASREECEDRGTEATHRFTWK